MSSSKDSARPTAIPTAMVFERSTDGIRVNERPEFWSEITGRRMQSTAAANTARPARARVRGIASSEGEFLDYTSDSMWLNRTQDMCNADGREEVSVGLVLSAATGAAQNGQELLLRRGDLYVIDFGRPVQSLVLNHHELAVGLPRRKVAEVFGDLSALGGRRLMTTGVGALLASHMRTIAAETARLSPAEQTLAVRTATDLALATLQAASHNAVDLNRFSEGLYVAACAMIDERCGDSDLTPTKLVSLLGCSRAGLYRLFARQGESVAAAIWAARLSRAHRMLMLPAENAVSLADAAFRCGFLDQSTFSRMFKRRYGMTPRDVREAGRL